MVRYITFWDQSDILIPCVEANRPSGPRSRRGGVYWPRYPLRPSDVSIPVGFVWEVANSERISPEYTTVYFCWVWEDIHITSGGGYWPRYPLRPSDVSIPVGFVWEVANSERISPEYTTVYFCWVWEDIHITSESGPGLCRTRVRLPESGFPIVVGYKNKVTYRDRIGP